ncbi:MULTISPECIES: CU044_2847 family protein [unclassified Streptomyces]|uniref:CU044_2847 family protein n=1 Tax=unclassified Streptomyces TaxID=2593676 RepID=UPI0036EC36F5
MAIVTGVASDGLDGPVYVEVDGVPATGGINDVYRGIDTRGNPAERVMTAAREVYTDGLDLARRCARQAADRLGDLGDGLVPDEVELQLSIKLDAELGAILVKSTAEAQLVVTFRWKPGGTS